MGRRDIWLGLLLGSVLAVGWPAAADWPEGPDQLRARVEAVVAELGQVDINAVRADRGEHEVSAAERQRRDGGRAAMPEAMVQLLEVDVPVAWVTPLLEHRNPDVRAMGAVMLFRFGAVADVGAGGGVGRG
jgi:hypothetical protein